MADIFTKPLGLNKLQHFLEMLVLQHLDVSYFSGKEEEVDKGRIEGSTLARKRLAHKGSNREDGPKLEPTKGKGRADGEVELETTNSDKGNDLIEPNHVSIGRVEGRRSRRGGKKVDESLRSRQAN